MDRLSPSPVVLIIDDEEAIRFSLSEFLFDEGYDCIQANDGSAGLVKFEARRPDLILLDLNMPGIDGLTVLKEITQSSPDTPIVVVSGTGSIQDVVAALRLGAWDYVQKPIGDFTVLVHAIETCLQRANLLRENREYQNTLEQKIQERTRELAKANKTLQQAAAQATELAINAKRANDAKSTFLANISHELKTPLNSILILASLLVENKENNLTEKQLEFVQTINRSGDNLMVLINDILDFSRADSGEIRFEYDKASLTDLLLELKQELTPLAVSKNITYIEDFDKNLPDTIVTDARRLLQVLKNLIGNAIKFTHQGTVTVGAKLDSHGLNQIDEESNPDPQGTLIFTITDTGIGIPEEFKSAIFNPFRQVDETLNRKYEGTGLGLAIAEKLAEGLGGSLSLKASELEKGSTFELAIELSQSRLTRQSNIFYTNTESPPPKEVIDQEKQKHFLEQTLPSIFKHKQVLIADSDMRSLYKLTEMIEKHQLKVITATDAEEAENLITTHPDTDLIISPPIFIENKQLFEIYPKILLVDSDSNQKKNHPLGPSAFMCKPPMTNDLYDCVDKISQQKDIFENSFGTEA